MADDALSKALFRALLALRITLGLFLLQWGIEKFVVPHSNVVIWSYFYGLDVSQALGYAGAVTAVAAPRLTLVGELLGRRLNGVGRLEETTLPHPRLAGVDTIRLTSSGETADRLVAVAGFKWNVATTWLLTANVLRPLTDVGLNAEWVPSVTFDYWFR